MRLHSLGGGGKYCYKPYKEQQKKQKTFIVLEEMTEEP